jgi:hypothetical protein
MPTFTTKWLKAFAWLVAAALVIVVLVQAFVWYLTLD